MARVTVEDCVERVQIALNLSCWRLMQPRDLSGSDLTIERDNDKNPVCALRKLPMRGASGRLPRSWCGLQKHVEVDEPEEDDEIEMMIGFAC